MDPEKMSTSEPVFDEPNVKTKQIKCQICDKRIEKYTCPKCKVKYCSLDCYKDPKHIECTENFYRNWVQTELQNRDVDDQMRQKMLEMLDKDREERENEDFGDNEVSLRRRMAEVDLDDEKEVWEHLSDAEKAEFLELLKQEQLQHIVPIWQPWWTNKEPLIADVGGDFKVLHPEIAKNVPDVKITASPNVKFNIINVLGCYVWCTRYYNGDYHENASEAAQNFLKLCKNLSENANFSDVKSSIYSVLQMAAKVNLVTCDAQSVLSVVEDLICVVNGPKVVESNVYVCAALSDLSSLFRTSRKGVGGKSEARNLLMKCEKKLMFYLHWVQNNRLEVLDELELIKALTTLESQSTTLHTTNT